MPQIGKIARMPVGIQEEINKRLEEGARGGEIAEWLNGLPEAKAVLAEDFDGNPVNEMNVSSWKTTGFVTWKRQREAMEGVTRLLGESAELDEATFGKMAEQLSICLQAQIVAAMQGAPCATEDPAKHWKMMKELCRTHAALRRGDLAAERVEVARRKMQKAKG